MCPPSACGSPLALSHSCSIRPRVRRSLPRERPDSPEHVASSKEYAEPALGHWRTRLFSYRSPQYPECEEDHSGCGVERVALSRIGVRLSLAVHATRAPTARPITLTCPQSDLVGPGRKYEIRPSAPQSKFSRHTHTHAPHARRGALDSLRYVIMLAFTIWSHVQLLMSCSSILFVVPLNTPQSPFLKPGPASSPSSSE